MLSYEGLFDKPHIRQLLFDYSSLSCCSPRLISQYPDFTLLSPRRSIFLFASEWKVLLSYCSIRFLTPFLRPLLSLSLSLAL